MYRKSGGKISRMTKKASVLPVHELKSTADVLRGPWIVLCPGTGILIQVVRPQDGGVSGQIVKVVHDDGYKQVQHLKTHIKAHVTGQSCQEGCVVKAVMMTAANRFNMGTVHDVKHHSSNLPEQSGLLVC